MEEKEVLEKLKLHIFKLYDTKSYYAKCKGLSEAYISMVLSGKKPMPQSMLMDIGMQKERVITFKYSRLPDQGRDSFQ